MPAISFKTSSQAPYAVPYPVRIAGLSGVVGVAAGDAHSLALLDDGTVRAWGDNRLGQLGDGTTVNRHAPVVVTGIAGAVAVVAGSRISAAVLGDGTVMTWGHGNGGLGRTGFKPDAPHPTPARVTGVTGIRAIACGESHVLAMTATGTVVSWGSELVGEVGHARPQVPTPIAGLTRVRSVGADVARSLATLADGTIMVWGNVPRFTRADGRAADTTRSPVPLVVTGLKNPL
jgi:alpha-tubulin suppressor-like RCC1 family protein